MDSQKTGKFISKMRKEKHLTQEQLAEKMGVSINAVSKWERGISFPDVSLYKKICEELSISIEELINGEKNKSEEAKDKAIFTVVKSKDKTKKRFKIVTITFTIVLFLLIIYFLFLYKNKNDELEEYYERNYQLSFEARNVEAFFKYRYDGSYPDYYGGMYISDDAYNLIVQIVKDKLPINGTKDAFYYNELFTVSDKVKIEYVKNSYNDLEKVYDKLNDYLSSHKMPKDFNSVGIDIMKNSIVVSFVSISDEVINDFKENILDSDLIIFENSLANITSKKECTNYLDNLGSDILTSKDILINIRIGNKNYVPVSLNLYSDGTYELYTSYETCTPGKNCDLMLKYVKSIKGTYDYDIEKILNNSTNANNLSFDMDHLPEYEIYLGTKLSEKYDTMSFVVEKGKKNKYLNELLKQINIDLSKCAKPVYKD